LRPLDQNHDALLKQGAVSGVGHQAQVPVAAAGLHRRDIRPAIEHKSRALIVADRGGAAKGARDIGGPDGGPAGIGDRQAQLAVLHGVVA